MSDDEFDRLEKTIAEARFTGNDSIVSAEIEELSIQLSNSEGSPISVTTEKREELCSRLRKEMSSTSIHRSSQPDKRWSGWSLLGLAASVAIGVFFGRYIWPSDSSESVSFANLQLESAIVATRGGERPAIEVEWTERGFVTVISDDGANAWPSGLGDDFEVLPNNPAVIPVGETGTYTVVVTETPATHAAIEKLIHKNQSRGDVLRKEIRDYLTSHGHRWVFVGKVEVEEGAGTQ